MYYCIERLLSCEALTLGERARLEATRLRRRAEYLQGLEIVQRHARFTPVGGHLLESAQSYMAAADVA